MALNLSEEPELYYAINSKVLNISKAAGSASSLSRLLVVLVSSVQYSEPPFKLRTPISIVRRQYTWSK